MFNSNELCQPLCLPYACYGIDTRRVVIPDEPAVHYFSELVLLREGRLRIVLGEESLMLSPGEAVLICPGVRHQILLEEEPARLDLIRMDPDRMPQMPEYAPGLKTVLAEAVRSRLPMVVSAPESRKMNLPEITESCVREAQKRVYGYDANIEALLSIINVTVIRFWMARGLVIRNRQSQEEPIYSLTAYIQQNLGSGLRVEELAARCGLSYPWFAKRFREIYGVNCKDFIERIRVSQVEKYLLYTDLDLESISEATGYADCSHMIKNFKRVMEITPGQYRLRQK